jgi:flagellar protein FlgJ
MKKIAIAFVLGTIAGASIILAFHFLSFQEPSRDAQDTLDFLIDEWTKFRLPADTILIAQIVARELPDARVGFFPDTVRSLATLIDSLYGIPKGVVLSQWALESRYGLSDLGARNYFGHTFNAVRSFMERPAFVMRREQMMKDGKIVAGKAVAFARYQTITECFVVHAKYLLGSKRYAKAFMQKSPERFAKELSNAGYATDPDYALKLIAIMRRYKLNA